MDDISTVDLVQEAIPVAYLMEKMKIYNININLERAKDHPSYNYIKMWQDNINYLQSLIMEYRASKVIRRTETTE